MTTVSDTTLLGSSVGESALDQQLQKISNLFNIFAEKLKLLDAHSGIFLLKNCFSLPRLLYVLRTSPTFNFQNHLNTFDLTIRNILADICNVSITDEEWKQASLYDMEDWESDPPN